MDLIEERPLLDSQHSTSLRLTAMELRNFRAFEHQRIPLAPITILVGPNNAGKSSALSTLRLLSQTIRNVDSFAPLVLGDFGTYKDVVFGNKSARNISVRIEFAYQQRRLAFESTFSYRAQRREVILRSFTGFDEETEPLMHTSYSRLRGRQVAQSLRGLPKQIKIRQSIRFYHFIPRVYVWSMTAIRRLDRKKTRLQADGAQIDTSAIFRNLRFFDRGVFAVAQKIGSLQYLGPFREQPFRVYPFSGERPSALTDSGHGATDILRADYFQRGKRKRELTTAVKTWLTRAQIASDLQLTAISDRHYDVKLRHPVTGEVENLADVGFGASQILPVIVAGYNLRHGSIFLVEQPEIHLHPRAQSELGDFFYHLYTRGIQSIVETHSEHLIMRIQRFIAEGKIAPHDVAVNYIDATPEGKQVVPLSLDKNGIFTRDWPHGFFEERLEEALELARAPLKRKEKIV